jgi:hypothetical protein
LSSISDILELTSTISSVNTTAKITVTVSDNTRNSSTFIELTILDDDAPILQITSSFLESINSKKELILNANVQAKDNSCNAIWTLDGQNIPQNKALTPIKTEIPIGNIHYITFVFAANQLIERNSFVFTLTCSNSFSSIKVTTNGPPINGNFLVLPTSGIELETIFTYSTSLWTDTDLPVTYQFSFHQVNSYFTERMTIQGKSEIETTQTTLPSGLELYNYSISCIVQIFDSLDCHTSTSLSVSVNKVIENNINLLEVISLESSTNYNNIDQIKKVIILK